MTTFKNFVLLSSFIVCGLGLRTKLVQHDVQSYDLGNTTIRISRDEAQQQCTDWEEKAWPMFSFTVYDDKGCNDNPRHFTNCVHYGDDFDGGEWNCNDVTAVPSPFGSVKTSGGMYGTQAFLLQDYTCPPSQEGEGDKLATFDPGDGRCMPVSFNKDNGYSVKNVGDAKIDGETRWIDSDAGPKRSLGKRDGNCSGFKWDHKDKVGTHTKSIDVEGTFTDCSNSADNCKITRQEGEATTVGFSVSVSVGSDFFVSFNTEVSTNYEESQTTTKGAEYSIPPGSKARLVASAVADSYNGMCTGCDGDDQPCNVVVPREEPTYHLEYNG